MTYVSTQNNDNYYAEQYNGAILLSTLTGVKVTLLLPTDYSGGTWLEDEAMHDMILSELILTETEVSSNKIALISGQSTGTAYLRIYPNIEPFSDWGTVTWTKTTPGSSTVTCDLYKQVAGQTPTLVASGISSGHDLSADAIGLNFIELRFTLTKDSVTPSLDTVTVTFNTGA